MMERVCPLCNGLEPYDMICNKCGKKMDHRGKMEDYLGPYSPYMDENSFKYNNYSASIGDNMCIHIYYCEECNKIDYIPFALQFF